MTKVFFTQPAEYDLTDIEYYVFFELENPQASNRIIDVIYVIRILYDRADWQNILHK